jgi:hypothetical protein
MWQAAVLLLICESDGEMLGGFWFERGESSRWNCGGKSVCVLVCDVKIALRLKFTQSL